MYLLSLSLKLEDPKSNKLSLVGSGSLLIVILYMYVFYYNLENIQDNGHYFLLNHRYKMGRDAGFRGTYKVLSHSNLSCECRICPILDVF